MKKNRRETPKERQRRVNRALTEICLCCVASLIISYLLVAYTVYKAKHPELTERERIQQLYKAVLWEP